MNDTVTVLCAFVSSTMTLEELAKEWLKDIAEFSKCIGPGIGTANNNLTALDYYERNEKNEMEKILINTQRLAIQAIEKELRQENMFEAEVEQKDREKRDSIRQQYEKIKKQQECIDKALEEKKKEAGLYTNKHALRSKIKQLSENLKKQIQMIREDLKLRIQSKEQIQSRNDELMESKITELKNTISQSLFKADKKGNYEECDPDRPDIKITEYCKTNYQDTKRQEQCMNKQTFCPLCCEAEFGDLHLDDRNDCYSKCDDYYIFHKKFIHLKHEKPEAEINNLIESIKKQELLRMIKNDLSNI
jgi:hypothetical protein